MKIAADEDTTTCLGIGEGIGTTLSLRLVPEFGASPVWALLSAGQIAAFPIPAGTGWTMTGQDDFVRRHSSRTDTAP